MNQPITVVSHRTVIPISKSMQTAPHHQKSIRKIRANSQCPEESSIKCGIDMLLELAEMSLAMYDSYVQSKKDTQRHYKSPDASTMSLASNDSGFFEYSDVFPFRTCTPCTPWMAPSSQVKSDPLEFMDLGLPRENAIVSLAAGTEHTVPTKLDRASLNYEECRRLIRKANSHKTNARNVLRDHLLSWKGTLPSRVYNRNTSRLSTKVFIGGLPWECTRSQLINMFSIFGVCTVEPPNSIGNGASTSGWSPAYNRNKRQSLQARRFMNSDSNATNGPLPRFQTCVSGSRDLDHQTFPGFIYIVFNSEKSVHKALSQCSEERGRFFYSLPCVNGRRSNAFLKIVQIIPWDQKDTMYWSRDLVAPAGARPYQSAATDSKPETKELDYGNELLEAVYPRRYTVPLIDADRTVFVGALHGVITASGLATIMSDLFGPVDKVMLDTDKYHYPIGSARVTFKYKHSYESAVRTEFVSISTGQFKKTIQIDPYLHCGPCCICDYSQCNYNGQAATCGNQTPFRERIIAFCRQCLSNFCSKCWFLCHPTEQQYRAAARNTCDVGSEPLESGFYSVYTEHVPLIRGLKEQYTSAGDDKRAYGRPHDQTASIKGQSQCCTVRSVYL